LFTGVVAATTTRPDPRSRREDRRGLRRSGRTFVEKLPWPMRVGRDRATWSSWSLVALEAVLREPSSSATCVAA